MWVCVNTVKYCGVKYTSYVGLLVELCCCELLYHPSDYQLSGAYKSPSIYLSWSCHAMKGNYRSWYCFPSLVWRSCEEFKNHVWTRFVSFAVLKKMWNQWALFVKVGVLPVNHRVSSVNFDLCDLSQDMRVITNPFASKIVVCATAKERTRHNESRTKFYFSCCSLSTIMRSRLWSYVLWEFMFPIRELAIFSRGLWFVEKIYVMKQ